MEPPVNPAEFPKMPEPGGRAHLLESSASMSWTLLFFAYSSSTFISEFPRGWPAFWTVFLVMTPICLVAAPNILDKRRNALPKLVSYLVYILVPSLLQLSKPTDHTSFHALVADLITALSLWLPLDLGLLAHDISPTGKVTVWGLLVAALTILNCFSILAPFSPAQHASPLGYSFKVNPVQVAVAAGFAVVYVVVAVPLAIVIRFGRFKTPPRLDAAKELATFFGIFMSSITEELLYRAVIQNMLEQRLGRNSPVALALAAVCYALSHIQREKLGFMKPNLRYALVSFVSGITSGLSWRYTGMVTTSALTRTMGDYVLYRVAISRRTGQ